MNHTPIPDFVATKNCDGAEREGGQRLRPERSEIALSDAYFLIHGNKASTPHEQGLYRPPFDDFFPSYSEAALPDRLGRYAIAHGRAVEMARFIQAQFKSVATKFPSFGAEERAIATDLLECGSYLHFRHFYTVNEVKLAGMCSCKRHLLCPLCAIRRAAKTVKAYMEKYEVVQCESSGLKAYLVTFTVLNGSDLAERFNHLQDSLKLLYAQRRKAASGCSNRNKPNEANKALGGVGSFEVKRGKCSGGWHPHAHFIWLCEQEPDVLQLQREWLHITGDSFMVDVTPFRDAEGVSGGFLEVFKYALKFSSMTLSDNWEAYTVLQRRRLVSSFGNFRGVEIPERLTDEISYDDLPFIELVFRYLNGSYKLTQSTNPQGNAQSA
ncbi:MAG TPA: protein rep [Oculatellaceae cyanobacterium]